MLLSPRELLMPTRRQFCTVAVAAVLARRARAAIVTQADVAAVERPRILAEATAALSAPLPKDLLAASAAIAVLTAAFLITQDDRYALRAGNHLYALFADPANRLSPAPTLATPAALLDHAPLAEIARALPFLADTAALSPPDLALIRTWLRDFLAFIATDRNAVIAGLTKDHTASVWLMLSATIARTLADETTLTACRHRFKTPTLRNQITANGTFPHELATALPLRNSLFNFDLLAAACESLSTPFATNWTAELEDGPGLRAVSAFLFPQMRDRAVWPFLADAEAFREVPLRRPALLFAGRAFSRPDYVDLWRKLPAPPHAEFFSPTYPIREPLLWIARLPHNA